MVDFLFRARTAWLFFIACCLSYYGFLSLLLGFSFEQGDYFILLFLLTAIGCTGVAIGRFSPALEIVFGRCFDRFLISEKIFHIFVWFSFLVFWSYALLTAEGIPIISALQGADSAIIDEQRGAFLKGRSGFETVLIYISTIFVNVLLPYSLASLFLDKNKFRLLCLAIFLLYTISFMQKALFLNVLAPILYVYWSQGKIRGLQFISVVLISGLLLFWLVVVSGSGISENGRDAFPSLEEYFSAKYLPGAGADYLLWRAFAVPLFSATDTLVVISERFQGEYLLGATSSLFSGLFSLDRINLERLVFEHQWSWNDTANTNAFYISDAYANFGVIGVFLYSFIIGQAFRMYAFSNDAAFKATWPLFFLNLFTGSLVPVLFGNGFLLLFLMIYFVKFR